MRELLQHSLQAQYENKKFTDFDLVSPSTTKRISCHKSVLSLLPVLDQMISSQVSRGIHELDVDKLGYDIVSIDIIVQLVYYGHLKIDNINNITIKILFDIMNLLIDFPISYISQELRMLFNIEKYTINQLFCCVSDPLCLIYFKSLEKSIQRLWNPCNQRVKLISVLEKMCKVYDISVRHNALMWLCTKGDNDFHSILLDIEEVYGVVDKVNLNKFFVTLYQSTWRHVFKKMKFTSCRLSINIQGSQLLSKLETLLKEKFSKSDIHKIKKGINYEYCIDYIRVKLPIIILSVDQAYIVSSVHVGISVVTYDNECVVVKSDYPLKKSTIANYFVSDNEYTLSKCRTSDENLLLVDKVLYMYVDLDIITLQHKVETIMCNCGLSKFDGM